MVVCIRSLTNERWSLLEYREAVLHAACHTRGKWCRNDAALTAPTGWSDGRTSPLTLLPCLSHPPTRILCHSHVVTAAVCHQTLSCFVFLFCAYFSAPWNSFSCLLCLVISYSFNRAQLQSHSFEEALTNVPCQHLMQIFCVPITTCHGSSHFTEFVCFYPVHPPAPTWDPPLGFNVGFFVFVCFCF